MVISNLNAPNLTHCLQTLQLLFFSSKIQTKLVTIQTLCWWSWSVRGFDKSATPNPFWGCQDSGATDPAIWWLLWFHVYTIPVFLVCSLLVVRQSETTVKLDLGFVVAIWVVHHQQHLLGVIPVFVVFSKNHDGMSIFWNGLTDLQVGSLGIVYSMVLQQNLVVVVLVLFSHTWFASRVVRRAQKGC